MAASPSLAGRALQALILMVGFYLLALAVVAGLLLIPYAEVMYAHRVHVKLTLICIIGALIILWSILPRIDRFVPPGPRLTPERHPELFAQLSDVAGAVGQKMPAEVYLLPDVNAWVTQRGGVMGIGGRRVMGLGLPLLQALTVSELRAVLAHEFGHFHGGDTKLGPWAHKTRGAITRTLAGLNESALQMPFLWYGKMFLRVTHAVSRHQEFAADALASRTVGARPLISGLRTIHGAALAFEPYWTNEVVPALQSGFRPMLASGYARFLKAGPVAEAVTRSIDEEIRSGRSDPYDTHPPLRERIAAIEGLPPGPDPADDPPAISLLSDLPAVEALLLSNLFSPAAVGKLKPVAWEEIGAQVFLPAWKAMATRHAADLKGVAPGSFPELAHDLGPLGTRLAETTKMDHPQADEVRRYASAVLGASLVVALHGLRGSIEALPGEAVIVRVVREDAGVDARIEPFNILDRLRSGATSAEAWLQQCRDLGIADLDLASVADPIPTPDEAAT